MDVGGAIRNFRKEKGMSQCDLAEAAGITQTSICQIENNVKRPKPENLTKIAKVLGVSEIIIWMAAFEKTDIPKGQELKYEMIYPIIESMVKKIVE